VSSSQRDGREVIAKRKGLAARRGLKEAWSKNASQCTRTGSEAWALGERAHGREAHIYQDAKRKSGGCAWKAVELIAGDLLHVST